MTDPRTRFTHQRLDAYRIALDLFGGVEELVVSFPSRFRGSEGPTPARRCLADRVAAMLHGLIRRERARLSR